MNVRHLPFIRIASIVTLAVIGLASTNCTTSYDQYGRPQQSVDPGLAIAGVAAAGVLGYALADGNHGHGHGHYYQPAPCYGPPRRGYRY